MPRSTIPTNRDTVELSPTGRAKCRICRLAIPQGAKRVGIETYNSHYDSYTLLYYHYSCVPPNVMRNLRLGGGRSAEDELAYENKKKVERQELVRERGDLRESLRQLRLQFARRLHKDAYMVFHNKTLDELTVKMPQTKEELLTIFGFGEKKYTSFGGPILEVIRHYRRLYRHRAQTNSNSSRPQQQPQQYGYVEDQEVVPLETLSCEDIVNRKFAEAEANGYVMEI